MQHEQAQLVPIGMGIDKHAVLYKTADRIIRAIKPKSAGFYKDILGHPSIIKLMDEGVLIRTRKSDVQVKGHDLVLEHPLLRVVSYPFEWTPNMYRDAAINMLRLNVELLSAGFCTHDAHPWNVLFDGTTPRFVDFTSIIKALPGNKWQAKEQFRQYCFNPLLVMEAGFPTTARTLLREIFSFPDPAMVDALLEGTVGSFQLYDRARFVTKRLSGYMRRRLSPDVKNVIRAVLRATRKISSALNSEDDLSDVKAILREVESLKLSPKVDQWSEYYSGNNELPIYDGSLDGLRRVRESTPKHLIVSRLLEKIKPKSVLDLGCNRGLYGQLAALEGAQVVGVDLDERALDDMYLDSKRLHTNALPLYVNAVAPAEAIGFNKIPFPSVTERLRSELVMSLALVHHLVFKTTRMTFAHIAKVFDSYADKFLLVEFIPKEDIHIRSWYTDDFDWYNLENFKVALSQYFPAIEVFDSFPSPRVLLYCEKG